MEWTPADSFSASQEGWNIFNCEGSDNGPWQLQCVDNEDMPEIFCGDGEAWAHVRMRAAEGSPLHLRAFEFLAVHNPDELAAIMLASSPDEGAAGSPGIVRKFLDLSIAHLPEYLGSSDSPDNLSTLSELTVYEHKEYGWFVYVVAGEDLKGLPSTLVRIMHYAGVCNCDYILFDRDGLIDPALPSWEW